MGNLTRGNLLATIKSLKKHKRPKTVVANAAVQAICGGSVPKPDKSADLKSVVDRRKAMFTLDAPKVSCEQIEQFKKEFEAFMVVYNKNKGALV